ncbi:hypothetical protein EAO75_44900, partial [Streptomyces sp. uw30]
QGLDGHGDKKDGGNYSVLQSSNCKSHDLNLDILGLAKLVHVISDENEGWRSVRDRRRAVTGD